jgi:hypothetical protein
LRNTTKVETMRIPITMRLRAESESAEPDASGPAPREDSDGQGVAGSTRCPVVPDLRSQRDFAALVRRDVRVERERGRSDI